LGGAQVLGEEPGAGDGDEDLEHLEQLVGGATACGQITRVQPSTFSRT